MKNEEIILRSFNRAIKNGFELDSYFSIGDGHPNPEYYYDCDDGSRHPFCYYPWPFYGIIFSHEFAKAFWGEVEIEYTEHPFIHHVWAGDESNCTDKRWRVHLSQMVLEEEPLKYLEQFL